MDTVCHLALWLAGLLVIYVLWKLRNYTKLYEQFPSYPVLFHIIIASVLGKIPSRTTFQGFLLQILLEASQQFYREGVFLAWLLKPHLFIFDEEAIKIFSNEEAALEKSCKYEIMRDGLGNGLITSNVDVWKKHRKMLNPVFHVGMLKNKLPIFNKNAEILVEKLSESIDEPHIDVLQYIKPCTFATICEFTLGVKLSQRESREIVKNYTDWISSCEKMIVYRFGKPWLQYRFMLNFIPNGWKYIKDLRNSQALTRKMILEMKENISSERNKTGDYFEDVPENKKSFSRILLDNYIKDPSFTIEDVESHVTTFLAAGYGTVAYSIMWCLFMLALHPEEQERVYNEILSIPDGHVNYVDLLDLKYLDCVVKESQRLFPGVPIYARRITKDIQCGKYLVPKDTDIVFFPYALHRNPKVFSDPEKFNPERFMDGNIENVVWNFIPFSEGIRNCIGKKFALLEMKVFLLYILRNFQITTLDKRDDVKCSWEIVLAPVKPPRFKLTPRRPII